jgi:hypothetical protein
MRTWAKIFFVAAVISGAISFTSFGDDFAWGALKPLSATFLGAAGICWFLAAEYARYNEEHKGHDPSPKDEPAQRRNEARAASRG